MALGVLAGDRCEVSGAGGLVWHPMQIWLLFASLPRATTKWNLLLRVCACVCMCVGTYMYAFVSSLYKMADGIGTVFCWETWVTPLFSVYWEIN